LTLQRMRQAIENASDAIGIGDMAGNSLYHNPAHVALFGYTVEQLNAVDRDGILFADPFVARAIHLAIRAGQTWSGETDILTSDGRRVPCSVRADLIVDETGRAAGVFGVFTDITQRLEAQAMLDEERQRLAEEKTRAGRLDSMGMLAAGVAHDFGNLLTAMAGNLVLAQHTSGLPLEAAKRLAEVDRAMGRAMLVTQQLVTFAKGGNPKKKRVDIAALLRESVGYAVDKSPVLATFDLDADTVPVEADEGQLIQVFNNLAVNAVQAMPNGGRLWVTLQNYVADGDAPAPTASSRSVRIAFTDTGVGIPPENLKRIFDPFFTTKAKGTGFGLANSEGIVKRHGGLLQVTSEVGRGTTFTILLPAIAEAPGRSATRTPGFESTFATYRPANCGTRAGFPPAGAAAPARTVSDQPANVVRSRA